VDGGSVRPGLDRRNGRRDVLGRHCLDRGKSPGLIVVPTVTNGPWCQTFGQPIVDLEIVGTGFNPTTKVCIATAQTATEWTLAEFGQTTYVDPEHVRLSASPSDPNYPAAPPGSGAIMTLLVNNGPMTFNPQEPPLYVAAQSLTLVVEPSFTAITTPAGGTMAWADNGTVQWSGADLFSFGRLTVIWPDDSEHVVANPNQPSGDGATLTFTSIQTFKPPAPGVVRFRFENQANNCFAEAVSVPSLTLT
jgi:hypothetical protein